MKQRNAFENNGSKKKDFSGLESRENAFKSCALDVRTLEKTNTICSFVNSQTIMTLQVL